MTTDGLTMTVTRGPMLGALLLAGVFYASADAWASSGNHALVVVECGDYFEYPALTAWDACDGDITDWIVRGGDEVDANLPGEYLVTYNVTDSSGNAAEEATRTVLVQNETPPVIAIVGDNPAYVAVGEPYADAGAAAFDPCNGEITAAIDVLNPVNTAVPGEYRVSYNVKDTAGNAADEVTRLVHVRTDVPDVGPLEDIALAEGAFYEWRGAVANEAEVNLFQWYRHDGNRYVPILDGPFGDGAYFGASTSALQFAPFTASMAARYRLDVSCDKTTVQRTASVSLEKDSELPATSLMGIAIAAALMTFVGTGAIRRKRTWGS